MGMTPLAVVEHFNVIGNVSTGILSGFVTGKEDPLRFQAAKKTLGNGIIPAVCFATHAADHPISL